MSERPIAVDFHCHLDLYPDFEEIIAECEKLRVLTLAVTTIPVAFERNLQLTENLNFVRAALGLHPQLVAERGHEFELFERLLPKTRFVGEIGLDASPRHYRSFEKQREIFTRILQSCAQVGDKVLSIHSTRATKHVLNALECNLNGTNVVPVLHWFTGSLSEMKRGVELGCYFSINGEMLSRERHVKMIREIPIGRILTETDGPFVATAGDVPVRPYQVASTIERLADIVGLSENELRTQIFRNAEPLWK
ncbi:TatD family hydrolase [Coraliomargarita sp. SDUM461004]|uniref:TatD family hydrolase n=1 Tax=Thalassobacterium sedimentorum TaxID=3041258 RepID=A0ABU1AIC4_9BACT|nr:Qat anti-phage system TatD family nuclease QatD [Coraliomargarita sp. SDUM461004]MDQ8193630.1 TatD family hydrolase [Coraliomargarita sp. SDUM461004]